MGEEPERDKFGPGTSPGIYGERVKPLDVSLSELVPAYEVKIDSGDPWAIAEVVRDLLQNAGKPDQSFSERQFNEAAMDRLAAELGARGSIDKAVASAKLSEFLKARIRRDTDIGASPGKVARKWPAVPESVRFPIVFFFISAPILWIVSGAPEMMLFAICVCGFTAMINVLNEKISSPNLSNSP